MWHFLSDMTSFLLLNKNLQIRNTLPVSWPKTNLDSLPKSKVNYKEIPKLLNWYASVENEDKGSKHKTGSYQGSLNREQATGSFWVSKELLDLIEAVSLHEQFINSFEETMSYNLESLEPISVNS